MQVWSITSLGFTNHFPHRRKGNAFRIDSQVINLLDARQYKVNSGTGWPSVITMCLGIIASLIYNFCDLKIGTPVATLPGPWQYSSNAGTGQPGVSILWLGRQKVWSAASISLWQHVKLSVQIRPWETLACCWDIKQPTNKTFSRTH